MNMGKGQCKPISGLDELLSSRNAGEAKTVVTVIRNPDKGAWDDYVADHPAAMLAHLYDWSRVLATTYELPVYRLATVKPTTGRINGVLPLMLFTRPGSAVRLVSLPYTDACGLLADEVQSAERLLSEALKLAGQLGAAHLELRQGGEGATASFLSSAAESWTHTPHQFKTGLFRSLPATSEALWTALSAKVRNQVRKARRNRCEARVGGAELLDDFYAVFAENMRDLGSPVHAPELTRDLYGQSSLGGRLLIIYRDAVPVAGAFVLQKDKTLFNPWSSSLRRQRSACPNMLLYWRMLSYAIDSGCRWFDFGRSSPEATTCRFKLQWGAIKAPLVWHVYSAGTNIWDPRSESLSLDEWKTLSLERSRQEGPAVRRWISL